MNVKTNGHWRKFLTWSEVPPEVMNDQFDHLRDEHTGFFKYLGVWYHVSDFDCPPPDGSRSRWHGAYCGSAFHAAVIELSESGSRYRVGLASW